MNVLLTHGYFLADDAKEQNIMRPYPPLGILYISAFLKKNGVNCSVFDTTFSRLDLLFEHLLSEKPEILALYTNLMTKLNVLKIIRFVKETEGLKNTLIVLGGPEVTHSAANFLNFGADVIVIGEGEETMLEVALAFQNKSRFSDVNGIAFSDQRGAVIKTKEREKRKDLDELPMPDREAIDLKLYLDAWKSFHGKNAISVSTMRGCPYTCKWCSRAVYGLSYRRRSPEKVVEELRWIQEKYRPDSLWFVDDVFTVSHKWMREFASALKTSGIKIPYECISRADRLNEEIIDLLKETGCFRVWIGAESGSQSVIDAMDRRVSVLKTREMIQLAKAKGIEAGTFIMLGYPGETEADIEETIQHLNVSDPDFYTITLAYPIKGTEMYQEVESKIISHLDWATSTDRQIEFKRKYSPKFYHYALKRVSNEVAYNKLKRNANPDALRMLKHKTKSELAKLMMRIERWRG